MEIEILTISNKKIALLKSPGEVISELQDALDLLGEASYNESYKIIVYESQLSPSFFDLKTGLAGEILQKFSTYNLQLAIIGEFEKYKSKNLKDFIRESNKYGRINFVGSLEEAKTRLTSK